MANDYYIRVGSKIHGSAIYGKKNTLTGVVTKIVELNGCYRLDDIVTILWSNGQEARFTVKDFHGNWDNS